MIRNCVFFFFYPCWERRRMERDRLMDWMMLPLTLYSIEFCGLKEGNLNILAFSMGERRRLRQRRHLSENKWRIKEKEKRLWTEPTMLG